VLTAQAKRLYFCGAAMRPELPPYPALAALPALRAALGDGGRAVLAAPPGSGKTTVVPLALLDEPWLRGRKIVMLEPRRVAARASAARMASLLGERVGETVGYQVRFERKVSSATRIEVITEGLLTRRLQADPELPGVGLVIFDEFHERSLDADLALALTLDVRANLVDDLRILVMSATLETQRVAALLGAAPIIEAGGRMYPVDLRYLPTRSGAAVDEAVADAVRLALQETDGDILAFLPGGREIRGAQRRLESSLRSDVRIMPLYGDLSSAEQDAALQPTRDGSRKIILATNIAQTSLTVEGVTTVVDSGWARVARFDLGAGANRLETQRISRASAEQRAGRAGRLGPGVAYRLWSRDQHGQLPAHDAPEILAADLSRFALELAVWGVADPAALALLDAPTLAAWRYARELLLALGAVDSGGITAHGRALANLPTAPRIAHMLQAAKDLGLAALAAWTAAALDERGNSADLMATVRALHSGHGDPGALRRVRDSVRQLLRLISADESVALDFDAVGRVLALAFPERVARRRDEARGLREIHYLCADGGEASIAAHEALSAAPWLAIAHWEPGATRRVRAAAAVGEIEILRDQAARLETTAEIRWDAQASAVIAERQTRLGAIVLERKPLQGGHVEARAAAMLQGLRSLGLAALPWSEAARQWQARVQSLRTWRPDEGWPDVSADALLATIDAWLAPHLEGVTRRDHLARLDLLGIFNAGLEYARQQQLARWAPTHIDVPSGSRIALDYAADGSPPVLAVKLQELFGLTQTPSVNDGRMRVSLHLLSPGRRPIQVTQDLPGFWQRTYPEVKKELKGRYPKHPWPDDPLAAMPTARAKPRGT
jgi:ATP-dependent helicase HrpB